MKTLTKTRGELQKAGRWDIDFHLPPEGIKKFPAQILRRVDDVADTSKLHRDPTKDAEEVFLYVDISSVDVVTGLIANPQDMEGAEAPSRARRVIKAFDIVVSTCRPTRGAIAVVPPRLHNQIASTGFCVLTAREGVNPFYLFYALRLPSTLEQFRKWSTGSSYPAILESDVEKTLVPVPDSATQDEIARDMVAAMLEYQKLNRAAREHLAETLQGIVNRLAGTNSSAAEDEQPEIGMDEQVTLADIGSVIDNLPPVRYDENGGRRGRRKKKGVQKQLSLGE